MTKCASRYFRRSKDLDNSQMERERGMKNEFFRNRLLGFIKVVNDSSKKIFDILCSTD